MTFPVDSHPAVEDCRLCILGEHEAILAENDEAFAVPSYGGFIEGWTLVVPRRHVVNSAASSPDVAKLLDDLVNEMLDRVRREYGDVVTFEHGAFATGRPASCGVDHAHIHIVPTRMKDLRRPIDEVSGRAYEWTPHTRPWLSSAPLTQNGDYIWIADSTGSWMAQTPDLPSQLVRRVLANNEGITTWNWREDHRLDAYRTTVARLSKAG